MPLSTWDIPTFQRQQQDIEEIDAALPVLAAKRLDLLQEQSSLGNRAAAGEDVADAMTKVEADLEDVELQRRGRLLLARTCDETNRRMLEDVSAEFLTKGEREMLGGLRLKLSRILFQYGEGSPSEESTSDGSSSAGSVSEGLG